jgi:predicted acyl esterase
MKMSDEPTPAELIARYAEQMSAPTPAPTVSATDPFFSYDRPATFGVHVDQVKVPVRDGSYLAGELLRPAEADGTPAEGAFPAIVIEFNGYGAVSFFSLAAHFFVSRGYVVVVASVRGSGETPGEVDPFGLQEQQDDVDLIEWIAAQTFTTGKVGQMGVSYGGHNTLLAAVNRPEHLVAVIAAQAISDWYENTIYRGGIPNARIHEWQAKTAPATLETYPRHPLYDDFWRNRSVKERWDQLTIPVLDVGGWLDPYRGAMVENYLAHPDLTWMVAGPWTHGMVPGQFEDIASAAYLAWWDYWLSDFPGLLPEASVSSYEMPTSGWKQYSAWPPAESTPVQWVMGSNNSLTREPDVNQDRSAASFETDGGSLSFTTEPLVTGEIIAGVPRVAIPVSVSASDGDIAVILEDVSEDGETDRISNGWLRISHRNGHGVLAEVAPGAEYILNITLWPAHYRLNAGHRLRVTISSEDYPLIDRVAPSGTVQVQFGPPAPTLSYDVIEVATPAV